MTGPRGAPPDGAGPAPDAAGPSADTCALCGRHPVQTTRHHLIPRRTHRLKRIRRQFDRQTRLGRLLALCRPCHKQIHALIDEKTLAERYNSAAALLSHPEVARFVGWIADKPPGFVPRTRKPKPKR
jgi:hypothetical protein